MADQLYTFVGAFVDELARAGLTDVCICPGSRSTPLALSFARRPGIKVWMHLDERSAAFFALGLARARRRPVALVCTSGTAVANFMPAVVEARQARVPMLVLTADRPPELRDRGAPQTIDQVGFYGSQVIWQVEMPLPEATESLLRFARTTACRAFAEAGAIPAGPVHLNFPFREPLVPSDEPLPPLSQVALHGRTDGQPYVEVPPVALGLPPAGLVERLGDQLGREPRGLIVCGPMDEPGLIAPLVRLAQVLGYPILADPLSGLRCGPHDRTLVIDCYDAFLRDDRFAAAYPAGLVLRFGVMPTAKPLLQYLQRHPDARQILIDRAGWRDPTLQVADVIHADPEALCRALASRLADSRRSSAWSRAWQEAARLTREALARELAAIEEPFEGRAMAELAALLPDGVTLFAGNSMPVRDIDTFFGGSDRRISLLGNRGASGIDGVTSTALGVAAASDGPVVLAIGDISFYHDMNGLLAAVRHGLSLTVVLLNNDGGGIFSFLPQAALPSEGLPEAGEWFELLFGTPHGLDFAHAAALYGASYSRGATWEWFRGAVRRGIAEGGLHILELRTERARNVALHRRLWPTVARALDGLLQQP